MILVDTSVWVDHLRHKNLQLTKLLLDGHVMSHPFVIGEIACGYLLNRGEVLDLLNTLPQTELATDEEVFKLIETQHLYGKGIGWVDVHLIASAVLSECFIFTLDRKLGMVARSIGNLFY